MTGPAEPVSIMIRWGSPRSRREAESYAVMAAVVREESACACDCNCDGVCDLLSVGAGEREEEIRGVRARSARWIAIGLPAAGGFAMVTEDPRL